MVRVRGRDRSRGRGRVRVRVRVDLVAGGGVREDIVAHGVRDLAVELDLVVVELHVLPAAAAVDGEAGVLAW